MEINAAPQDAATTTGETNMKTETRYIIFIKEKSKRGAMWRWVTVCHTAADANEKLRLYRLHGYTAKKQFDL